MRQFLMSLVLSVTGICAAFDGTPWNVSTGNLSTFFIQASPIGPFPKPDYYEAPPPIDQMKRQKEQGLIAYEDYLAWGAIEREPGKWQWKQHDAVRAAVKEAGLKYVAYNWVHFPPAWLRESGKCTLMKSLNTGKECNFLSVFDPRTIEYYNHFYKNLAAHFGDNLDGVYACILGPYGEGNYPLYVPDWVKVGPSHEGYWCGDEHALVSYRAAMKKKYSTIDALNNAWETTHTEWAGVCPPSEIREPYNPCPVSLDSRGNRQRWLDFITWYHQAIIDFTDKSVQVTLKYFPKEKVRTKPGGNAGGVNPIAWGTYCPGYAKMAGKYGIVLQPADCQGAYFGDKWVGTAYQYYKVPLGTEPASALDHKAFVQRMFSDASCGARQLFTYEFDQHTTDIQDYVHLYTGKSGETEIAVMCPTTLYRLGGDLKPSIEACKHLRDVCEYDVLDELLIADGALTQKYKVLIVTQPDYVESAILDKVEQWVHKGGRLFLTGDKSLRDINGNLRCEDAATAGKGSIERLPNFGAYRWVNALAQLLPKYKGADGKLDGLLTCRRGHETIILNNTDKPTTTSLRIAGTGREVTIEPHSIVTNAGN